MPENNEVSQSLECNVPASINIEEMIVGRLSARQLSFACVGAAIAYNLMFKMGNKTIGWTLGILVCIMVYFLGFYKIKKYDVYLYEYAYYIFKYNTEQQFFINR